MPAAVPDRVERQLDRIEILLTKLAPVYRMAYEVGYCAPSVSEIRRRTSLVADPTAHAVLAPALEAERRLVAAAAAKIEDALNGLQCARQNLQEAIRIVDEARPPSTPTPSGPLLTRRELQEARQIRQRQDGREQAQRRDARRGRWVDLG